MTKKAKKRDSGKTTMLSGMIEIVGVPKASREKIAKVIKKGIKEGKAG